jgi:hypothetical protein
MFALSDGPPELDIVTDSKVPLDLGLAIIVQLYRLSLDRFAGSVRQSHGDARVFQGVRKLNLGTQFGGLVRRVEDGVDTIACDLGSVSVDIDGLCARSNQ